MKGFLILCVVLGHIVQAYYLSETFPHYSEVLKKIQDAIYAFHMPLFMMVSGYLYYSAYYSKEGRLDKRRMVCQVLNLLGVYFLFNLIYGLLKILTGIVAGDAIRNEVLWIDILLIPIKPLLAYWYLYTLAILYVLFVCIEKNNINKWVLLLLFWIISSAAKYTHIEYFTITKLMTQMLFFYIGLSYKKYGKWILGNIKLSIILFVSSFTIMIASSFSVPQMFGVDTLIALGISLGVWLFFEEVSFVNNGLLEYLGKSSLEIYVTHNIVTTALRYLFKKVGINQVWICICLNLVFTISICVLFSIILKRLKIHKVVFRPATFFRDMKENRMKEL